MSNANPSLLRVWYGNTTTPPLTQIDGSMYVTTGWGNNLAQLHFDLGGQRYTLKGGTLDHTFTVGGVAFDGSSNAALDTYTYTFGQGSSNGTFKITPYKNGTAQTALDVAIKGLGTAAYTDSTAYLAANGTAVEAQKLSVALSIYNNSNTALVFGDTSANKTIYIGNDLVVGNGTATAMTSSALTNGSVHLIPLYQQNDGTWVAKRHIAVSGTGGVSVTTTATGDILISGTTYSALPNPGTLTFSNAGTGTSPGTVYDGSTNVVLSYHSIGAAAAGTEVTAAAFGNDNKTLTLTKANGNLTVELPSTAAINISGNAATATSAGSVSGTLDLRINGVTQITYNGSNNREFNVSYALLGTIPEQYLPASALERLYVTATTSTNNSDALAIAAAITAQAVQAGDVIQVNGGSGVTNASATDGIGKMYFVYDNNGTLSYKEFTAGTTARALTADKVKSTLTITATQAGANNANLSIAFTGETNKSITIPLATATNAGLISSGTQTIAGDKTFTGKINGANAEFSGSVKATGGFTGNVSGKATTAGTADQVKSTLTFSGTAISAENTDDITFTGLYNKTIGTFTPATASAAGHWGLVPTPPSGSEKLFMTGGATWWGISGINRISATYDTTNNLVKIGHSGTAISARTALTDNTLGNLTSSNLVVAPLKPSANSTAPSFTLAHVLYDTWGHITGAENKTITFTQISYTPHSQFSSEGYEIGTISDGTTSWTLRGGIVWETFS